MKFLDTIKNKFLSTSSVSTIRASFEAGRFKRRLKAWQPTSAGPIERVTSLDLLRRRSRDMCRNNPIAVAMIERLVSSMIGAGITAKASIDDKDLAETLRTTWDDWIAVCDFDNHTDFNGLQTLACRSMLESGECLIRLVPDETLTIPLRLQVLESDYLSDKTEDLADGHRVIDGIEFDNRGRRVAYWMYDKHPGDETPSSLSPIRIPENQIIHLFEKMWPGQIRGVPDLLSILVRLKDLDEYDDAVLYRQKIANLFVGFIRKPLPTIEDENAQQLELETIERSLSQSGLAKDNISEILEDYSASHNSVDDLVLEPGFINHLPTGMDITFSNPPDSGSNYLQFVKQQITVIAAARFIPYAILTFDFSSINDRTARVAIMEYRRRIEQRIWTTIIPNICVKVRNAWIDAGLLEGVFPLGHEDIYDTEWTPYGWPYINPEQDVKANVAAIEAGIKSQTEVILERGEDPEVVASQRAVDKKRDERYGLSPTTQTKTPTESGSNNERE